MQTTEIYNSLILETPNQKFEYWMLWTDFATQLLRKLVQGSQIKGFELSGQESKVKKDRKVVERYIRERARKLT